MPAVRQLYTDAGYLALGPRRSPGAPVHVHTECLTGDTFGHLLCDCRHHLDDAHTRIGAHGAGVLVYRRGAGRGLALLSHPSDPSDAAEITQILKDLGVRRD